MSDCIACKHSIIGCNVYLYGVNMYQYFLDGCELGLGESEDCEEFASIYEEGEG